MPVTQKEIANRAGIDRSVVAHVLRGDTRVAEATRQRVLEIAAEMGYTAQSNLAARALIARRHGHRVQTGQIALLMGQSREGHILQEMPFFQEILDGVHTEARERNLDVAIHILREGNLPRVLSSGGVNGAICVYSRTISRDLDEQGVELPVVRLDDYGPGHWTLCPENEKGCYEATRHLLDLGHTRIAFLGGALDPYYKAVQQRLDGYRRALHGSSIVPSEELILFTSSASEDAGLEGLQTLMGRTKNITAVVCANDALAVGAIKAAAARGLKVPEDLSITGFDGVNLPGYGGSPQLTTACFDRQYMGRRAVSLLEDIAQSPGQEPRPEILPTTLRVSRSTAAPAATAN